MRALAAWGFLLVTSLAVAQQPTKSADDLAAEGFGHYRRHEHEKAIALFTKALAGAPRQETAIRDARGDCFLLMGKIDEAIADFDAVLKVQPRLEPEHWRRGIALYYAGKYADGVKQFETHKNVNPQDVENAAWHYLCNVHVVGKAPAKAALIDVTKDARVPMAEIQKLFAGTMTPDDVLKAANAINEKTPAGIVARGYAHLYIGLWYESEKNAAKAKEHLTLAAEKYPFDHYMGFVAKMHAKRLNK